MKRITWQIKQNMGSLQLGSSIVDRGDFAEVDKAPPLVIFPINTNVETASLDAMGPKRMALPNIPSY